MIMNNIVEKSGIEYSGHISLKLKIGNKTYKFKRHNEGLEPLFKLLCYAITKQSFNTLIPVAIDIGDETGHTKLAKAVPISALAPFKDTSGTYGVRIVALLQNSNISGEEVVDGDYLYLLASNKDKLARMLLSEDAVVALNSITSNVNGQIEWEMRFKNATEEEG